MRPAAQGDSHKFQGGNHLPAPGPNKQWSWPLSCKGYVRGPVSITALWGQKWKVVCLDLHLVFLDRKNKHCLLNGLQIGHLCTQFPRKWLLGNSCFISWFSFIVTWLFMEALVISIGSLFLSSSCLFITFKKFVLAFTYLEVCFPTPYPAYKVAKDYLLYKAVVRITKIMYVLWVLENHFSVKCC